MANKDTNNRLLTNDDYKAQYPRQNSLIAPTSDIRTGEQVFFSCNTEWRPIITGWLSWLLESTYWDGATDEQNAGTHGISLFLQEVIMPSFDCNDVENCLTTSPTIANLQNLILALQTADTGLQAQITDNDNDISTINSGLITVNNQIQSLETDVAQNIADISALTLQQNANTSQIATNISDIASNLVILNDHESRITTLENSSSGGGGGGTPTPAILKQLVNTVVWPSDSDEIDVPIPQGDLEVILEFEFFHTGSYSTRGVLQMLCNNDPVFANYYTDRDYAMTGTANPRIGWSLGDYGNDDTAKGKTIIYISKATGANYTRARCEQHTFNSVNGLTIDTWGYYYKQKVDVTSVRLQSTVGTIKAGAVCKVFTERQVDVMATPIVTPLIPIITMDNGNNPSGTGGVGTPMSTLEYSDTKGYNGTRCWYGQDPSTAEGSGIFLQSQIIPANTVFTEFDVKFWYDDFDTANGNLLIEVYHHQTKIYSIIGDSTWTKATWHTLSELLGSVPQIASYTNVGINSYLQVAISRYGVESANNTEIRVDDVAWTTE